MARSRKFAPGPSRKTQIRMVLRAIAFAPCSECVGQTGLDRRRNAQSDREGTSKNALVRWHAARVPKGKGKTLKRRRSRVELQSTSSQSFRLVTPCRNPLSSPFARQLNPWQYKSCAQLRGPMGPHRNVLVAWPAPSRQSAGTPRPAPGRRHRRPASACRDRRGGGRSSCRFHRPRFTMQLHSR